MRATDDARWIYARSKLAGEEAALRAGSDGLQTIVARLFNTVGPRQTGRYGMVLPNFVRQGLAGEDITVVVANDDESAVLSFRNLPQARVITASEANTYDLVDNTAVLFTQPALVWVEEVLV